MLSLNKTALFAALAVSVSVGGYVLVDKYNGAIALSESLTEKNNALTDKLAKLGVELQSSEADKLKLMADIKTQERMFNDHLVSLADVTEQQTVVQTKLKEVFIYDQANKDWGNTPLPDDVKRVLLNATRTKSNNDNKASAGVAAGLPP
tara:strand:+ start:38967 stop:39413 length:447 start_codon:yes stop_codon:yes gene_type:complete